MGRFIHALLIAICLGVGTGPSGVLAQGADSAAMGEPSTDPVQQPADPERLPSDIDRLLPDELDALLKEQSGLLYSDPQSSMKTIRAVLDRSRALQNDSLTAKSLLMLANTYLVMEYHTLAYETFRSILETPYAKESVSIQNRVFNNMGIALEYLSRLEEALAAYLQSVEIERRLGNEEGVAESNINIGLLFLRLNDNAQARTYLKAAEAYFEGDPDSYNYALVQQNLSIYHLNTGDYEAFRQANRAAYQAYEAMGYSRGMIQLNMNLADGSIEVGRDLDEAADLLENAALLAGREKLDKLETDVLLKKAMLALTLGDPRTALEEARRVEDRFETVHEPYFERQIQLYEVMLLASNRLGLQKESERSFEAYKAMVDSLNLARQRAAIDEMLLRLEDQGKTEMLQRQTLELQSQRSRNQILTVLFSAALLLLAGGWAFYRYRETNLMLLYEMNMSLLGNARWPESPMLRAMLRKRVNVGDASDETGNMDAPTAETIGATHPDHLAGVGAGPGTSTEPAQTPFVQWPEAASASDGTEVGRLFDFIDAQIRGEKWYADPDLSSPELALKLKMSKTRLSELIKSRTGLNFSTFINTYRIQEAMRMLSNHEYHHYSMEKVMELCGFRSRSAFYAAFERASGMSPAQFRRQSERGEGKA